MELEITYANEEIKCWIRDIYFQYENEEQYAELKWEEDYGYEIISSEFTPNFRKALDEWHETTDELFESLLDDLTWQKLEKKEREND